MELIFNHRRPTYYEMVGGMLGGVLGGVEYTEDEGGAEETKEPEPVAEEDFIPSLYPNYVINEIYDLYEKKQNPTTEEARIRLKKNVIANVKKDNPTPQFKKLMNEIVEKQSNLVIQQAENDAKEFTKFCRDKTTELKDKAPKQINTYDELFWFVNNILRPFFDIYFKTPLILLETQAEAFTNFVISLNDKFLEKIKLKGADLTTNLGIIFFYFKELCQNFSKCLDNIYVRWELHYEPKIKFMWDSLPVQKFQYAKINAVIKLIEEKKNVRMDLLDIGVNSGKILRDFLQQGDIPNKIEVVQDFLTDKILELTETIPFRKFFIQLKTCKAYIKYFCSNPKYFNDENIKKTFMWIKKNNEEVGDIRNINDLTDTVKEALKNNIDEALEIIEKEIIEKELVQKDDDDNRKDTVEHLSTYGLEKKQIKILMDGGTMDDFKLPENVRKGTIKLLDMDKDDLTKLGQFIKNFSTKKNQNFLAQLLDEETAKKLLDKETIKIKIKGKEKKFKLPDDFDSLKIITPENITKLNLNNLIDYFQEKRVAEITQKDKKKPETDAEKKERIKAQNQALEIARQEAEKIAREKKIAKEKEMKEKLKADEQIIKDAEKRLRDAVQEATEEAEKQARAEGKTADEIAKLKKQAIENKIKELTGAETKQPAKLLKLPDNQQKIIDKVKLAENERKDRRTPAKFSLKPFDEENYLSKRAIDKKETKQANDEFHGMEIVILNAINYKVFLNKNKAPFELFYENPFSKTKPQIGEVIYKLCTSYARNNGNFAQDFIYDLQNNFNFIEIKYYKTLSSTVGYLPLLYNKIFGNFEFRPVWAKKGGLTYISDVLRKQDDLSFDTTEKKDRKLIYIWIINDGIFILDVSTWFKNYAIFDSGKLDKDATDTKFISDDLIYTYDNKNALKIQIKDCLQVQIQHLEGLGFKFNSKGLFYKPKKGQMKGGQLVDTSNAKFGDTSTEKFKASSDFNEQLQKQLNDEPVPQLRSGSKADRDKYREEMALYNKRKSEKQKEFMGKYKEDILKANDQKFLEAGYTKDKNGRWQKPASLEDVPWLNDVAGAIGARNFLNKAIKTGETFYNKPNLENTIALGKTAVDAWNTGKNLAEKVADPKKLVKDIAIEQGKKLVGAGLKSNEKLELYKNGNYLLGGKTLIEIRKKIKELVKKPLREHILYTLEVKNIPKNKTDKNILIKKYLLTPNLDLKYLKYQKSALVKNYDINKLDKIHNAIYNSLKDKIIDKKTNIISKQKKTVSEKKEIETIKDDLPNNIFELSEMYIENYSKNKNPKNPELVKIRNKKDKLEEEYKSYLEKHKDKIDDDTYNDLLELIDGNDEQVGTINDIDNYINDHNSKDFIFPIEIKKPIIEEKKIVEKVKKPIKTNMKVLLKNIEANKIKIKTLKNIKENLEREEKITKGAKELKYISRKMKFNEKHIDKAVSEQNKLLTKLKELNKKK